MRWTIVINEVSAGCYECEAIRSDHRSVAKRGFEGAIPEVLRDAFEMELSLGTPPHEAAFYIIEGLKPQWRTRFDFDAHQSWTVFSSIEPRGVEYNGETGIFRVFRDSQSSIWTGVVGDLNNQADGLFEASIRI
jgi:hypothetical protein